MAQVVVIQRVGRELGMVEVTLSCDGVRFTVHVPETLDESPDAESVYQAMADATVRQANDIAEIRDANKGV